jgi:orotate phosphoribosyltransferase
MKVPIAWQAEIDANGPNAAKYRAAIAEAQIALRREFGRNDEPLLQEKVGTTLKSRIEGLLKIKAGQGCGCTTLAAQMDAWGIAGCESQRSFIVDRLLSNRGMLADAVAGAGSAHSVIGWALNTRMAEPVLRAGAEWLLNAAIDEVKKQPKSVLPTNGHRHVRRFSGSPFRAVGNDQPRFITSAQFQSDIKTLLAKVPSDIRVIAGVARSGLSVASMLAMYLQLPMITIRHTKKDVFETGNGWRLGGDKHIDPRGGRVLVVDDVVMTGNSLKAVRPIVKRHIGDALFAAVYVNPLAATKPDFWAIDLSWPHLLEWNLFNSVLSPCLAMDFDGIICHDCRADQDDDGPRYRDFLQNAVHKYLPRRLPVPLIVTARLEKYRGETEVWLRQHGVQWEQLVMHPAGTLRERNQDDIAAFKARHFADWASKTVPAPGPFVFAESDDRQASRIAQLSGRMVVCPGTAQVY